MPVARRTLTPTDTTDYESEMLELARAQLQVQQRISSYVGFFFWLALVAVLTGVGFAAAALAVHFS